MIRQRDASTWPRWREEAKNSLLANFAKHLCRDEVALLADRRGGHLDLAMDDYFWLRVM
jgi:hypothetical protein